MFKTKAKSNNTDVSKQMDELLGKPPVPHKSSAAEYNTQEDELLNLRVKLQQKEKALAEREKGLGKELKELESEIQNLKKNRAELWSDIDSLKRQHGKYESEIVALREEEKAHKKQIKYAEEVHELLSKKQAMFSQKELELKKRETNITHKEKELDSINKQIKEKETTIIRLSALIQMEKESFEKRKRSLLADLDSLDKKKTLLTAQVNELNSEYSQENKRLKQATHDVKELYEAAELKNLAIDKRALLVEKELDKKRKEFTEGFDKTYKELNRHEQDIMKHAALLDKRELDLKQQEYALQKELERLQQEQKGEASTRKNIIELTSEERIIEQRLADKKLELTKLTADYQSKISELVNDRKLLEGKEDEVVSKIKELESDQRLLSEKEEEFIEKIHELEKDKKLFDRKVAEFSDQIDKIDSFDEAYSLHVKEFQGREDALHEKQLELELKERKMVQAAEYKLNIANLKKEQDELQKQLKKLNIKVSKASEIEKKFALRERRLTEYENMLKDKDQQIQQLMNEMVSERNELSTQEFTTYFQRDMQSGELLKKEEEVKNVTQLIAEEKPANYSILQLMQKAREAVVAQQYTEAKNIYAKLNALYKSLPANEEKKKIYYEILELKTDIELSMV